MKDRFIDLFNWTVWCTDLTIGSLTADRLTLIDRSVLNWIGALINKHFKSLTNTLMDREFAHTHTRNSAFTLTVFAAAVQSGLCGAGGDVEEAIHEEESIREEDVL